MTADLALTSGAGAPISFVSTHVDTVTTSGFKLWQLSYGNPSNPGPDAQDGSWQTPTGPQLGASATCAAGVQVVNPRVCITKNCVNPCTPYGQPIQIAGTVNNCGDETLAQVTVVDNPAAVLTFTMNGNPVNAPFTLAPGATVSFTGQYTPANTGGTSLCGPFTDTVTVTAVSATTLTAVNASASATCHVLTRPHITLVKDCRPVNPPCLPNDPKSVKPGEQYTETFTVTNDGDVPLVNVVVHDSVSGNHPCGAGQLAPGQSCTVTVTLTAPLNNCNPITDRATATADNICPADATCPAPATVTSAEATCTMHICCAPKISIAKTVACTPPGGVCDGSLPYAETATGIQGAAFCYKITVCNPPDGTEPLNNVVVTDPDLGGVLPGFPPTLAIGQCETRYFKKGNWPLGTHVNTATSTGVGASTGIRVTTNDTATAILVPIGVRCSILLHSSFDQDANNGGADGSPDDNHVTLPDGGPVHFSLTIVNTGQADLSVAIAGAPCAIATPVIVAAGATAGPFECDFDVLCPAGANINVTVTGTAIASANVPCIYDSNGNAVETAPSSCTASVNCESPTTCRVTGGGQLIPGFVDQSCIPVNTTIFPFTSPNGLTIKKITHGGQLGAPFSQMDCGAILGNPCIRGQWSHTRHYEGQANPRDVFDMNFHSQTPKGQYDSLSCACLGCCDPESGAFIPPVRGPLIHKFQLCNPDDHKICGPQPRPSPANAIIWSGIGKVTPTDDVRGSRAAQAEWVVFRVYIEDRSEPGGGHPGGAVEPADIYCFQAWKTGIKVSKKPDFTVISTAFRQALGEANCAFLASLEAGTHPIGTLPSPIVNGVTADIQDCGPMHDGNHQIHPATGATCTE